MKIKNLNNIESASERPIYKIIDKTPGPGAYNMVRDCSFDNLKNKNVGSSFGKAKKNDNTIT